MKKIWMTTALMMGMAACVVADPAGDKAAITQMYASMDKAVSAKNFAALRKNMAPGAKYKTKQGQTIDAATALKSAESQMGMMKSIKLVTKVLNITVNGNKATVKTNATMNGVMVEPTSKKTLNIKQVQTSVDSLIRGKSGWQIQLSEAKEEKTTINGKSMEQFAKEMREEMAKKPKK